MAQTRISFSQIGVTSSMAPRRVVINYPVLWILNPNTGRCKRYDLMDYQNQITKKNYRGIAETAHFVVVITDSNYYSFARTDGSFIKTIPVSSINGREVGVQADGILFLDGNTLILRDQDFNILISKELSADEMAYFA